MEAIKSQNLFLFKFDLIFCDPPFKNLNLKNLVGMISDKNLLKKNGILVFHRRENSKDEFPNYLNVIEERIYGKSKIIFARFLSG